MCIRDSLRDRPMRVWVQIDGQQPVPARARTVLVANVGRLQGGMTLLTEAEPDDGRLDVAVLTPRTLRHWSALAWALLRRRDRVPRMQVYRGRQVTVSSDRDQPRQLDGDLIEPGRALRATVRPGAVRTATARPAGAPDLSVDADAVAERGADLVDRARDRAQD